MSADEANRRYSRYIAPLEPDHTGEYAAVSSDGKVILGQTMMEAVDRAAAELGPDNLVFKVGQRVVGKC